MTEAEWNTSGSSILMWHQLRWWGGSEERPLSRRKVRLWGVALVRTVMDGMPEEYLRAIELAEQMADGRPDPTVVAGVKEQLDRWYWRERERGVEYYNPATLASYVCAGEPDTDLVGGRESYWSTDISTLVARRWAERHPETGGSLIPSLTQHPVYLRDIFGNPFRPVAFDPAWRTSTAVALAKHMYESRDFSPMPILADALQDAGCDDESILSHCRDPQQVHVRGCWVVDLVLGKS